MRQVLLLAALSLAFGCRSSEEHGRAPAGQFEAGGPIDARGNAATARSLGQAGGMRGSAEAPAPPQYGHPSQERLADRYDAGGGDMSPSGEELQLTQGEVEAVGEDTLEIRPLEGPPISLELGEGVSITQDGTLISHVALEEGAQVSAAYRREGDRWVAQRVELQRPAAPPPSPR